MSDIPERMPEGVVKLDVGCFRQKSPEQIAREKSPEYLEAEIKRILEKGPPKPPNAS
jgi:hypothetical protein